MEKKQVMDILDKIQVYRQSFLITPSLISEWSYLTRYLKTIEQKKDDSILHVNCQLCNRKIKYEDYKKHYERCSSADYIVEMAKRYFNQNLSKDKMLETSEEKFQSCY